MDTPRGVPRGRQRTLPHSHSKDPLYVIDTDDTKGVHVRTVWCTKRAPGHETYDTIEVEDVIYYSANYWLAFKGENPLLASYISLRPSSVDGWDYEHLWSARMVRSVGKAAEETFMRYMFVMEDVEHAQVIELTTLLDEPLIALPGGCGQPVGVPYDVRIGDRFVGRQDGAPELRGTHYLTKISDVRLVDNVTVRFGIGEPLGDPLLDAFCAFLETPTVVMMDKVLASAAPVELTMRLTILMNMLIRSANIVMELPTWDGDAKVTTVALELDVYLDESVRRGLGGVLTYLCHNLRCGNVCALSELERYGTDYETEYYLQQEQTKPPAVKLAASLRDVRNVLYEAISLFLEHYIGRTYLCFDISDYSECFVDTFRFTTTYSPTSYKLSTIVWRYVKRGEPGKEHYVLNTSEFDVLHRDHMCNLEACATDRFVLADGSELTFVPPRTEGAYAGCFVESRTQTIVGYRRYRPLALTNVIRLQFYNIRTMAKASLYEHPMVFYATGKPSREDNIDRLRTCKDELETFNAMFWVDEDMDLDMDGVVECVLQGGILVSGGVEYGVNELVEIGEGAIEEFVHGGTTLGTKIIVYDADEWKQFRELLIELFEAHRETDEGAIFYRFVNDTLYAYKLLTLIDFDSPHAMALMLHCHANTKRTPRVCVLNVNSRDEDIYGTDAVSVARARRGAEKINLHKSISTGICGMYTYLCAEMYLLCAHLWQRLGYTGMVSSKVVLYMWLSRNKFDADIGIDFFDPLPRVPMREDDGKPIPFAQRRETYNNNGYNFVRFLEKNTRDSPGYQETSEKFLALNDFRGITSLTGEIPAALDLGMKRRKAAGGGRSPKRGRRAQAVIPSICIAGVQLSITVFVSAAESELYVSGTGESKSPERSSRRSRYVHRPADPADLFVEGRGLLPPRSSPYVYRGTVYPTEPETPPKPRPKNPGGRRGVLPGFVRLRL